MTTMTTTHLYEVWLLERRPPELRARFRRYEDATRYVRLHRDRGSHDIRLPDGTWHSRASTAPDLAAAQRAIVASTADEKTEDG